MGSATKVGGEPSPDSRLAPILLQGVALSAYHNQAEHPAVSWHGVNESILISSISTWQWHLQQAHLPDPVCCGSVEVKIC